MIMMPIELTKSDVSRHNASDVGLVASTGRAGPPLPCVCPSLIQLKFGGLKMLKYLLGRNAPTTVTGLQERMPTHLVVAHLSDIRNLDG